MKKATIKISYTLAAIIAVILFIFSSIAVSGAQYARAAATANLKANYENRNVLDDLKGSTIGGKKIDFSFYNFNEQKNVQLISFIEFCYSFKTENQSDYGLYVYVYNPRGYDWTKDERLNKIQLRAGGDNSASFKKYSLKYLNRSEEAGKEGLFYKFKIEFTNEEKTEILSRLNSNERIYEVGEIELYSAGTNATAYNVSNEYSYTGYAKGYGSESAETDTLSCSSDGLVTLTLDVHPTQYMPEGSSGGNINERDILYSVYFSIPNEILNEYGGLSAVHATWLNAKTRPIYVTENQNIYSALNAWLWDYQGIADFDNYPEYSLLTNAVVRENPIGFSNYLTFDYDNAFNIINILPEYKNSGYTINDQSLYGAKFSTLTYHSNIFSYIFSTDGESITDFVLPGNKILEHISEYTDKFGVDDNAVLGKYNSLLFSSWDDEFTEVNKRATDNYTLTSEIWGKTFWEELFGGAHVEFSETFKNIKAIKEVKASDFKSTYEETCKNLYIDKNDYDEFKDYYDKSTSRGETTFIFRYYQDKYESKQVTECQRLTVKDENCLKKIDTKAYAAQMVLNLDFDIIDVTCSKGKVETVIPVIASPIDIAPDAPSPIYPITDTDNNLPLWAWVLIIVTAVIFTVIILLIIFPEIVKAIFNGLKWLVCLPFTKRTGGHNAEEGGQGGQAGEKSKLNWRIKLMIGFTILFIIVLVFRILAGVFVDKVSWFAPLLTPFTWLSVGLGIVALAFIIVNLIKKIRK